MENNVYSAPKSDVDVTPKDEIELANRGTRLVAAIIDGIIMMCVTMPVMWMTGGFENISQGVEPGLLYTLGMGLFGVVAYFVINGHLLFSKGQTVGKKAMDIRIVTMSGDMLATSNIARRYGFYMVVPMIPVIGQFLNLVNILFIFGSTKRCIHDYVGNTQVVKGAPEQVLAQG